MEKMLRNLLCCILIFFVSEVVNADVVVRYEKGEITENTWVFDTVRSPSANDRAQSGHIVLLSNSLQPYSYYIEGLIDGYVPDRLDVVDQSVFLNDLTGRNARILLDLHEPVEITEINTYSGHDYTVDGGARGPQVYTLYGIKADPPHFLPERDDSWTKIARVDTRPNLTGDDWLGVYGVSITSQSQSLGTYRYLLWQVEPTNSPQNRPGLTHTFYAEFDVHTAQSTANTTDAKLHSQVCYDHLEEVIIVNKTHVDIGFTDLASDVIHQYRTSFMDHALGRMEQTRQMPPSQRFVWTVPGWMMHKILEDYEGQDPDRQRRVIEALEQGYFAVHALPYTTHTDSLDPEDMVRGLYYSANIARKTQKPLPTGAKMTDVPSHSWILPTLMKNAGANFLHLGCNPASQSPAVPNLFWWEGPDGSQLLTMYYGKIYASGSIVPPRNWPHKTWMAMPMTWDNHGPPPPEQIQAMFEEAERLLPEHVNVRLGTLDDFAEAILAESPDLPVIRGDMPDNWIHGIMSMPQESALARINRPLIRATESLNTLLSLKKTDVENIDEQIFMAYDNSLRFGEHTWGLNSDRMGNFENRSYGSVWKAERQQGLFALNEESWVEKGRPAHDLADFVDNYLNNHLELLAAGVNVDGKRLVVYNALPWKRTGTVEIELADRNLPSALKDAESGNLTQAVLEGNTLHFIAEDVPSMGYKTYVLTTDDAQTASGLTKSADSIENQYFKVEFDPSNGRISSIIDKTSEMELVDNSGKYGFGQYFYQRAGRDRQDEYYEEYIKLDETWPFQQIGKHNVPDIGSPVFFSGSMELEITKNDLFVSGKMFDSTGPVHDHSVTVTLYDSQPYISIEWNIYNKEPEPLPEGGWLSFPLRLDNPKFRLSRLGAIIDPVSDTVPNTDTDKYALYGGLSVVNAETGMGIGLCSPDLPLVSLDRPGLWRFSTDFIPEKPNVFFNLFNNQWGTNFQQWVGGSWSSTVHIWTFSDYDDSKDLAVPSAQTRTPLVAGYADTSAGDLPLSYDGLGLSRQGIAVTAFGQNPDGAGTILRLWEQAGQGGPCRVTLPRELNVRTVQPVNLRGEKIGQPIAVRNQTFSVNIEPNQPVSFVIQSANMGTE